MTLGELYSKRIEINEQIKSLLKEDVKTQVQDIFNKFPTLQSFGFDDDIHTRYDDTSYYTALPANIDDSGFVYEFIPEEKDVDVQEEKELDLREILIETFKKYAIDDFVDAFGIRICGITFYRNGDIR